MNNNNNPRFGLPEIIDNERIDLSNCDYYLDHVIYHMARYKQVMRQLNANDLVLDVACGDGYGARMLAQCASQVIGVDIDAETIKRAKEKYHYPNLSFLEMNCTKLDFVDNSFDVITSFETLEHVNAEDGIKFLDELKRVLKPGGILFLGTPRAREDRSENRKKHHPKEYSYNELKILLEERFARVLMMGQLDEVIGTLNPSQVWTFFTISFKK